MLLSCSVLAQTPSPAPSVSAPPLSLHDRANALLNNALADKNPDTRKAAVQALSLASLREPYLGEVKSALDDVRTAGTAGKAAAAPIADLLDHGLTSELTVAALDTLGEQIALALKCDAPPPISSAG